MKILYLSCHSVLEFDEVSLFNELGYQVFSPGAYVEPANPGNISHRPGIPNMVSDPVILEMYHKISGEHPGEDFKNHLTKEFVDFFDIVIIMHLPRWIENNWEVMKHKPVVWRTIGQSNRGVERSLKRYRDQGMKIVRYSPKEKNIPEYIGEDIMIRFYKNPDDYKDYMGSISQIVNISQAMFGSKSVPSRGDHMSKNVFDQIVNGLPWKIFGPDNDNAGEHNGGALPFEDLKSMLRMNRIYLYTGTRPAMYTLAFMEAFMTGIPVVSIGPVFGNEIYDQKTFEVHELIGRTTEAGFWSDSIDQLKEYCVTLLNDQQLAKSVGERGRQRAIELFGRDTIAPQWQQFLESLV